MCVEKWVLMRNELFQHGDPVFQSWAACRAYFEITIQKLEGKDEFTTHKPNQIKL